MPEYIPGLPQGLMASILQSTKERAARTPARDIAQAVSSAINEHYKDKEMKIAAAKEAKTKESMGLLDMAFKKAGYNLDFSKAMETQAMPAAGAPMPEGFTAIPEAAQAMGIPAGIMKPREKTFREYEAIDEATSMAIKKEFGIKLPAGTPKAVATTAIAQKGASDRADKRRTAYSKYDQAYKELSDMVQDLPGVPVENWTPKDKANYAAWLKATKDRGITVDDIAILAEDAPQESKGFWAKIGALIGWKQATKKTPSAPSTAPKPKLTLPGFE